VNNVNDRVGRITTTGVYSSFADPAGTASTDGPQDITLGPDGNLWYTSFTTDRIGRVDSGVRCAAQKVTVDLRHGGVPTGGNDVIRGTVGPDNVTALGGNDRFCGLEGGDSFFGGTGNDRAFGGPGVDTLRGDNGLDRLDGGGANDTLRGGNDNDSLLGQAGNDTLEGGGGNDVLNGGANNDTCRGQTGGGDTGVACETRTGIP